MKSEQTGLDLRDLRRRAGLSADAVARRVDVHCNTVLRWERHERFPSPAHLNALACALGVPLETVVKIVDAARPPAQSQAGARGVHLRQLRKQAQVPVRTLAELSGVRDATVYNWEHGCARVPDSVLPALATALRIETDTLIARLRGSQDRPPSRRTADSGLARLRKQSGMTVPAAARAAGIPVWRLRALERGVAFRCAADVLVLAQTYGARPQELLAVHVVEDPDLLSPSRWQDRPVAARLRAHRRWHGQSQVELASLIGCSRSSVRAWEAGRVMPPPPRRRSLEELWGLPEHSLDARPTAPVGVRS